MQWSWKERLSESERESFSNWIWDQHYSHRQFRKILLLRASSRVLLTIINESSIIFCIIMRPSTKQNVKKKKFQRLLCGQCAETNFVIKKNFNVKSLSAYSIHLLLLFLISFSNCKNKKKNYPRRKSWQVYWVDGWPLPPIVLDSWLLSYKFIHSDKKSLWSCDQITEMFPSLVPFFWSHQKLLNLKR